MEYTGERYVPWEPNAQASYEHYHRYTLALSFAKGKRVLDLASGEGYGTSLLATVATEITGVDIDEQAVEHATNHYIRGNLNFIQGPIQNIPIQDRVFDLITCFEAIEHVSDQEKVLDEALRLLSDDGILIISTPNKLVYTDEAGQPWPWHVREFYYSEFRDFIQSKFKDVIFLGQKVIVGSSIWPLVGDLSQNGMIEDVFIEKQENGVAFVDINQEKPMFFLAIAAKKDLSELRQSIKSNYFIDTSLSLVKEKNDLIEKLKSDVGILDHMVGSKDVDLSNLNKLIETKENDLAILNKAYEEQIVELDAIKKKKDEYLVNAESPSLYLPEIDNFKNEFEQIRLIVQQKDADLAHLSYLYSVSQTEYMNIKNQLSDMDSDIQQKEAELLTVKEMYAEVTEQFTAMRIYLDRKEQDIQTAASFINEVNQSLVWRLLSRYRSVINRIAPVGSFRRKIYNTPMRIYRRLRNIQPAVKQPIFVASAVIEPQPVSAKIISSPVNKRAAVCTIASKNYLSLVRVFAASMARSNPEIQVYVLLVDRIDNKFDPDEESYHVVTLEELDNIPNPTHFFFKYNPIELNTAAKPYFMEYLIEKFGLEKLCYFDPDIYVFSRLDRIWQLLENNSLVLTPHITEPYPDDRHPNELEINLAGVFNLGFLGVSKTDETARFLKWWQQRLYDFCYMLPSQGMHVDQNWANFAPTMHDRVFVLRDLGYNIAYWNLHERGHRLKFEDGNLKIDGRPAVFFHFSGFSPQILEKISTHQDRYTLNDFPNLRPVYEFYRDQIQEANYAKIKQWPYAFGKFDNGIKVINIFRSLYSKLSKEESLKFGNPFSTSGPNSFFSWMNEAVDGFVGNNQQHAITRLQMELYNARVDLQRAFPDPLGVDRERLSDWIRHNAQRDFNLDPIFIDNAVVSPTQAAIPAPVRQTAFSISRVVRPVHGTIKEYAKRVLPSDSYAFQKLSSLNRKYFEKASPITYQPVPVIVSTTATQSTKPFGVNVAGYIQGEFGVAEVSRASLSSLVAAQVPHVLNNVDAHGHRNHDKTFDNFSSENPYRVNLVHVNADQAHVFAEQKGAAYFQDRYNIACWFWELSAFPKQWRSSFDYYQEIWVASGFCQESIASQSPIPVVKMTFPILVDEATVTPDRKLFGLPEDKFIYGFVFDYLSLADRKNPYGLINAFKMAFGQSDDALLLIKTINGTHAPEKVARLHEAVEGCNVQFINDHLSRQQAISLVASVDSYVSLHRAEGLGIGMAQAMYLNKPVIATGYSGNMEFMNHNNSFLVKYKLAELQENYGPYEKGNVWAEPDLEHAAELMRKVYDDRAFAKQVADQAAYDIKTRMNPTVTGQEMAARLALIAGK